MKTLLAFCMIIQALYVSGQEEISSKKGCKIGLKVSYYPTAGSRRFLRGSEDVPMINGKEFYSAEIVCLNRVSKKLDLESGLGYANHSVEVDPWGINNEYKEVLPVLYIPVALRYNFHKYAFVSSGIFFGFDFSEPGEFSNQTGIGLSLSGGFNYEFRNKTGVSVSPYINLHSWLCYDYGPFNNDKLVEISIKLGLYYRL
ncbi:MAG TPA: hypothetical protein VHI78_14080 [Bacteroidales bacterium]|nr:hypothetical protein [Bacteroidales bacterium]